MTEGVLLITDKDINNNNNNNTGYNIHEQQPHHQLSNLVIKTNNGERAKVNDDDNKKKKKKKLGVFGFFKAAMFVLRHRSSNGKQQKTVEVAAAALSDWKKLVSSMRPLHLQDNNKPASALEPSSVESMTTSGYYCPPSPSVLSCGTMSQYASANDLQALDDPHSATMSQYSSSNELQALDYHHQASSSSGTMSQYASANNLQELDDDDEEDDDPDKVFDSIGADDMIDVKAEEFILQFYQQMRRQNIDSMSGQFD